MCRLPDTTDAAGLLPDLPGSRDHASTMSARLLIPARRWLRGIGWGAMVVMVVLGAACATIPSSSRGVMQGTASWYGKPFHGRLTANGERYDMYQLTAAHRTLSFGTRLRVTSLENGRSVIIRINDRGPFVRGRIIDLSLAAAKKIGMVQNGTARVKLERLPSVVAASDPAYTVQVGAFSTMASAEEMRQSLRSRYRDVSIIPVVRDGAAVYRVHVGRVASIDAARSLAGRLKREGLSVFVTRQDPKPVVR